jgi:hypothetical protein
LNPYEINPHSEKLGAHGGGGAVIHQTKTMKKGKGKTKRRPTRLQTKRMGKNKKGDNADDEDAEDGLDDANVPGGGAGNLE